MAHTRDLDVLLDGSPQGGYQYRRSQRHFSKAFSSLVLRFDAWRNDKMNYSYIQVASLLVDKSHSKAATKRGMKPACIVSSSLPFLLSTATWDLANLVSQLCSPAKIRTRMKHMRYSKGGRDMGQTWKECRCGMTFWKKHWNARRQPCGGRAPDSIWLQSRASLSIFKTSCQIESRQQVAFICEEHRRSAFLISSLSIVLRLLSTSL